MKAKARDQTRRPAALWLVAGLTVVAGTAAAEHGWVPVDCGERAAEVAALRREAGVAADAWEDYERRVRGAAEGGREWVPHPYPRSEQEVVQDFLHGYFQVFRHSRRNVEPRELPTLVGLERGTIRFAVERVENWQPDRCSTDRHTPFHHLVRLFDATGVEVARSMVHPSGQIGMYGRVNERRLPLPLPADLGRELRERYGLEMAIQQAQLVSLAGLPSRCSPTHPCLAFRSNGRTYVMESGAFSNSLYEIPDDSPRMSVREWGRRRMEEGLPALCNPEFERPLATVGFGWAEARRVAIARGEDGEGGRVDEEGQTGGVPASLSDSRR